VGIWDFDWLWTVVFIALFYGRVVILMNYLQWRFGGITGVFWVTVGVCLVGSWVIILCLVGKLRLAFCPLPFVLFTVVTLLALGAVACSYRVFQFACSRMQLPCVPVRMQSHAVTVCSSAHAVACNCRVFQFACISHAFAFLFPLSVITLMRGVVLTCMAFLF
jgi:hypothetical protein